MVWGKSTVEDYGTYTVTVTGNRNFTGNITAIYTIRAR
jgi:hypothetical protein